MTDTTSARPVVGEYDPEEEDSQADPAFRLRIIRSGYERVDQLVANPKNWRVHPRQQQEALDAVLSTVGWVAPVIVNERTRTIVDGHMRVTVALQRGEARIPVNYVDLTEEEEDLILATFDPISSMAVADTKKMNELLASASERHEELIAKLRAHAPAFQRTTDPNNPTAPEVAPDADVPPLDPAYTHDEMIDAAFDYWRAKGFPYRQVPLYMAMQTVNKLRAAPSSRLVNSTVGYRVVDTYHPHRFHARAEGRNSIYEAFMDDKKLRRAIEKELQYGSLQETGVNFISIVSNTQAVSNFRPAFACLVYRRFCMPGYTVLDPCMGYGGRLLGFHASGIPSLYIGTDPHRETYDGNVRMASDLGFSSKTRLYNLPAEDLAVQEVEGVCDFVFTSPPYFSKERYSDDDTQSWVRYKTGAEWRDGFLRPLLSLMYAALRPDRYALLNIADVEVAGKMYPLLAWARSAAEDAGFRHVRDESFPLPVRQGSGHEGDLKEVRASEPILVLYKGTASNPNPPTIIPPSMTPDLSGEDEEEEDVIL